MRSLGRTETDAKNYDPARDDYSQARDLYKRIEDDLGQANALLGLGDVESKVGNAERRDGIMTKPGLFTIRLKTRWAKLTLIFLKPFCSRGLWVDGAKPLRC